MTFDKPTDMSYSQMAQWIDSQESYTTCDEYKLCQYLYHLCYLRCKQGGYFRDEDQVDDFSIYCLTRILPRIQNTEKPALKSISNYIRNVVPLWRADYIREFCTGSPDLEITNFDVFDFGDYLVDATSAQDYNAYSFECIKVSDVVYKHLLQIPRRTKSSEWGNIYLSCLLTLTDRLNSAKLISSKNIALRDPSLMDSIIRSLKTKPPILFHIEDSMSNYITTLVNEITHAIAAEVSYSTASKVSVSSCLRNMVIAAFNDTSEE